MHRLILLGNVARGAIFGFEAIPSLAHSEDYYRLRDYRNVQVIGKYAYACI